MTTALDVRRKRHHVPGVDVAAGKPELRNHFEHTDEANLDLVQLRRHLVRKRHREGSAAAEANDIDHGVARFQIVLEAIHRLPDSPVAADSERFGRTASDEGLDRVPMPFRYKLP